MSRATLHNLLICAEEPKGTFDVVVEWALIALLAFMPLALGVVARWSEAVVVVVTGLIACCLLLRRFLNPKAGQVWSWAYVPIVLFVLLAMLQLVSVSPETVRTMSPNTLTLKAGLLRDLPNAGALLHRLTLSFYPVATRHDLRVVFAATVVFFAVIDVFRSPNQTKRLLAGISLIGGAVGLLALAQDLSGTTKIYWKFTGAAGAHSGPFVLYTHYSEFMNLSIGAALGLLMVNMQEKREERKSAERQRASSSDRPARLLADLGWSCWLVAVILVGAITICVSMSRAGMLTLLISGLFTATVVSRRSGLRGGGWALALIGVAVFICLLIGDFDAVYDRVATLLNSRDPTSYRSTEWPDILDAVRKFPLLGTGLGTHDVIYPMFDTSNIPGELVYADNDYLQAAEETGLVGLVIVLSFAGIMAAQYAQAVRPSAPGICVAAIGLGFGLLSVMITAVTDYGEHLPAIGCLTAVTCGMLVNLARSARSSKALRVRSSSPALWNPIRLMVPAALAVAAFWAVPGAITAYRAQAYADQAARLAERLAVRGWEGAEDDSAAMLAAAARAAAIQPDNVEYRYRHNCSRWEAIRHQADPRTGVLQLTPDTLRSIHDIVNDLRQVRASCPTFGPVWAVTGQLEKFVLADPNGSDEIRIGYSLCPNHPATCFAAGLSAAQDQRWPASVDYFRRCLLRDASKLPEVTNIVLKDGRPDLAVEIVRETPDLLLQVACGLQDVEENGKGPDKERNRAALATAMTLLSSQATTLQAPAPTLWNMGELCRRRGDRVTAIEFLYRALSQQYEMVDCRSQLAHLLALEGRSVDAMHEAQICLRLRPQMQAAKQLIEELTIRPGARKEEQSSSGRS